MSLSINEKSRWPNLRVFAIRGLVIEESELMSFLMRHSGTLAPISFTGDLLLPKGGDWDELLTRVQELLGCRTLNIDADLYLDAGLGPRSMDMRTNKRWQKEEKGLRTR